MSDFLSIYGILQKFGLFKEEEYRIYGRLENIWLYTEIFDLNSEKLTVLEKPTEDDVLLEFKSSLGTVRISLWRYFDIFQNIRYGMEYSNYAGSTVFKLYTGKTHLAAEPLLGENITADDIDLAILELEEYLEEKFGDIVTAYSEHLAEENRKKELHKKELEKLV